MRTGSVEFEHLVGGGFQAGDFLQVDDRLDDADEHQPIISLEHFV